MSSNIPSQNKNGAPERCAIFDSIFYFFLAVFAFTAVFACFDFNTTFFLSVVVFFAGRCFNAACAAARRAIGTRNGEQET